ncbi:MAG: hypothetical protein IPP35_06385 [Elusimicrobia bacterium]|nr:hypothetical protein [Elusimicrobiota bacterium]
MKWFRHLLIPALFAGMMVPAQAEDKPSNAKLRLPWEILQGVLKLDSKNVRLTWEEYRTLLRLTSSTKTPDFNMAGGDVVLSRAEFTRLVQSLVPPAPQSAEASVSKASYRGRLAGGSAIFSATLRVEVPRRPPKPIRLDLFPGNVAFQEITIDGRPALADVENGRLYVTLAEAGSRRVDLRFSLPVPESNAAQSLTMPIARTPITEWILDIPERNLDIAVPQALHREISPLDGGTRVRALLPPSNHVTAAWNPLAPDTAKGPAQVYADVDHLISVQEDALRVKSRIAIEVLQNTINNLTLDLPEGFTVLDVQGEAVREWQENAGKPATLAIPFRAARKGRMDFTVVLERVLSGEKSTTTFTGVTVQGAVRQRGFLGVELNSDAELPTPVTQGLEPKDPFRELPAHLAGQSARLLFGYKYVRPPFALSLALSRHESVTVVPSVIDRAEGTTVMRPDGKNVHQITYWIRSSAKQFLEVSLPEGVRLWSAFVDGAPVKPVRGEGKKTLIPLVRSLRASDAAFPVEIVTYEERPRLSFLGRETLRLPMPDVLVSRLQWSVVTPPEQEFVYLGRDFEKPPSPAQTATTGSGGFFDGRKSMGFELETLAEKPSMSDRGRVDQRNSMAAIVPQSIAKDEAGWAGKEEMGDFADAESSIPHERFEGDLPGAPPPAVSEFKKIGAIGGVGAGPSATAGVLPVRVSLPPVDTWPTVVYSKTLPEPNALLALPLYHAAGWVRTGAWVLAYLLLGVLAWIFRAPIRRWTAAIWPRVKPLARKAGPLASPFGALFAGLLAVLGASYGPSFVFGIVLILYSLALVRWVLSLFDPAEGEKS